MGSCSNYSALERYVAKFGGRLQREYEDLLLGRTIDSMADVEVDFYVQSTVILDDGSEYETHFRWASQEEDNEGIEIPEGDEYTMADFYEKFILGKKITKVTIGYDRDDMLYCYAFTTDPAEDNICIEIPLYSIDDIFDEEAGEDEEDD